MDSGPAQLDAPRVNENNSRHWSQFAALMLGAWLVAGPSSFGYDDGRMAWSDILSGASALAFTGYALIGKEWARWGTAAVGVWLMFAPLAFSTNEPAAYLNGTMVGALLIGFSILLPGMPGMRMMPGPETPPGWSYNPSTWAQRAPMIALAFVAFLMSRYLAASQLGHVDHAWDPFFGTGTFRVLTSEVSRAWPVSDAGLGAFAYMLEVWMGLMGGRARWRTMPWMVLLFGILVIPVGVASIVLVILQPVAVGYWCTLCLGTAGAMLAMIPFAVDEVVAMAQFLAHARREGAPIWTTFWKGGTISAEDHMASADPAQAGAAELLRAGAEGVSLPWNLALTAALGTWLMVSPAILGLTGAAADNLHVLGPLVVTVAFIATAEVIRPARYAIVPLGLWTIASVFVASGADAVGQLNAVAVGAALIGLSIPGGRIEQRYGTWTRWIARDAT